MNCRTKVNLFVLEQKERLELIQDLLEDTVGIVNKPKEVRKNG